VVCLYYLLEFSTRSSRGSLTLQNTFLLIASLFFYSWGEGYLVGLMLVSITCNYFIALGIDRFASTKKWILAAGLILNLSLLATYKYADFIVGNINTLLLILNFKTFEQPNIHLPLGISFFTFQAMSYIIDVYRGDAKHEKNLFNVGLYIALFPQLIAGPIVRFHDIAQQIVSRTVSNHLFFSGLRRFIFGLAKKVLIANTLGEVADEIFALDEESRTMQLATLGIICYTLQIYFDFSGYSDMAIGLGRMFGFRFLENFNYPYISSSIQEFWRRWHMSLSRWFRDYLYIPLGGGRVATWRVYFNLVTVFFLCGLWHGASWNFVVWGMIHGIFLILERAGLNKIIERTWRPLCHAYVLFVVIISWVFFRADTLSDSLTYLRDLFSISDLSGQWGSLGFYATTKVIFILVIGFILSTPAYSWLSHHWLKRIETRPVFSFSLNALLLAGLLFLCVGYLASDTYNPFIYFRF
jgi:alginate O-acetyltransferase complex protein AlgI